MNVLSLFDGMSCGQIALNRLGINVDEYFASEIDKYSMQVTKKNYPNTQHIGNVLDVKGEDLPKIDLLIGGSPCQGFSFAGKQLNFDDPRSKLFFEFVRLLDETKPRYFLLENVRMKKEYQEIISEHLGVEPVMINSTLVSAQNRVRLYWTNIPGLEQPEDKQLVMKDILEDGFVDRDKSHCLDANYFKGGNLKSYFEKHRRQLVFSKDGLCHVGDADLKGNESIKRVYHQDGKCPTLTTMGGGHREPKVLCGAIRGRYIEGNSGKTEQRLEIRQDEKTNTLTTVQKDNVAVLIVNEATKKGYTEIEDGDCFDNTFPTSKTRRGRNMKDKSNCLTAANYEYMRYEHPTYRKLTPLECERLQTVPDFYTEGVSNTQRYKMLGNGWTVDVIAHIFKGLQIQTIEAVA
jgi:DNA-cytosine methyltransferase